MSLRPLDSVVVVGLQTFGTALAAATVVYLASLLGPNDFGRYVYYLTTASILPLFLGLGGEHVLLMFASRKPRLVPVLFGNAMAVRAVLTMLSAAVIAVFLAVTQAEHARAIFFLSAGALLAVFPNPLFLSLYRVQGTFIRPLLIALTHPVSFIVYLAILPRAMLSFESAALGFLLSQALTVFVFAIDISRRASLQVSVPVLKRYTRPGMIFAASQGFDYAFVRLDIMLIQHSLGPFAVGVYAAAQKLVSVFTIIPSSFHVVELPEFHRVSARLDELLNRFRLLRRLLIELGLVVFGLLIVNASYIIGVTFTVEYRSAVPILCILSIAGLIAFVNCPYYILTEAINKIQERLIAKVFTFGVTAAGIAALAWLAGTQGAAVGFVLGQAIFVMFLHHLTRTHNGGLTALLADSRSVVLAAAAAAGALSVGRQLPETLPSALLVSALYLAILVGVGAWLKLNNALAMCTNLMDEAWHRVNPQRDI